MSLGYHNITLQIENHSGSPMRINDLVYVHGKVNDFSEWPEVIPHNGKATVKSNERDWSVLGVGGYAVYELDGTKVTIAFICPPALSKKVNVGTASPQTVYAKMEGHGSEEFGVKLTAGNKHLLALCQVESGWVTHNATVKIVPDRS